MDVPHFEHSPLDQPVPFSMIPNDLIRNPNIKGEVKWFIIYLLSHSDNWIVTIPHVMKSQKISSDRMYRIIDEAIESGYVQRDTFLVNGKKRYKYWVSREPKFKKCLLFPEIQDTEIQYTENQGAKEYQEKRIQIKEKREREASPPPIAQTHAIYRGLMLENKKYEKLIEEFGIEKVNEMKDRLVEYGEIHPKKFKAYGCHCAVIRKWIREDRTKEKVSHLGDYDKNKKWADDNKIALEKYPDIHVHSHSITFDLGQQSPLVLLFKDHGFKEQLFSRLHKMGIASRFNRNDQKNE